MTGSVNQKGEVQPIGGVNQKIEGFFQVCQAKGLTGEQGVLIPHQNLRNLMLREEVVDAVKAGKFHVYSAKTIDEGIEILTGMPAGNARRTAAIPRTPSTTASMPSSRRWPSASSRSLAKRGLTAGNQDRK